LEASLGKKLLRLLSHQKTRPSGNPSYVGGIGGEDHSLKQAWAKSMRLYLEK
jgi:hypothetical protein